MPAMINSPTRTEMTLMDVRSAHEIAEAIQTEMQDDLIDGDTLFCRIEALTGLLQNCLVRHRVSPFTPVLEGR